MDKAWDTPENKNADQLQSPARSTNMRDGRPVSFVDGRFILQRRIGGGSFGDLYQAQDTRTGTLVAVKLEKRRAKSLQLSYESKLYATLHRGTTAQVGIPRVYYYGTEGDYNLLVMELCGPSLDDLFNYCVRRFSVKTVCMLADQMLQRLDFLHTKGFIHRDIKPDNFVFGTGRNSHILYLIDFGLSKPYWDMQKMSHIPFCEGKLLTGTTRYCSSWTHRGYEQSRRDDMEAIGYMTVYFLSGSLPWQGINVKEACLKAVKIGEKKLSVSVEELCKGLPTEVLQYCKYCRELKFTDQPDYEYLRNLFFTLAERTAGQLSPRGGMKYDWVFDWFLKRTAEVQGSCKGKQLRSQPKPPSQCENTLMGPSVSPTAVVDDPMASGSSVHVVFSRYVYS